MDDPPPQDGQGLPSTEDLLAAYRARRRGPAALGAEGTEEGAAGLEEGRPDPEGRKEGRGDAGAPDPIQPAEAAAGEPAEDAASDWARDATPAGQGAKDAPAGGPPGRTPEEEPAAWTSGGPGEAARASAAEPTEPTSWAKEDPEAAGTAPAEPAEPAAWTKEDPEAAAPEAPPGASSEPGALQEDSGDLPAPVMTPLGPAAPGLGFEEVLPRHPFLAPRGSRAGRALGVTALAAGLLLLAAGRRDLWLGQATPSALGVPLWQAALLMVLLGVLAAGASTVLPWRRRVRPRLSFLQEKEWARVLGAVRGQRVLTASATVTFVAGLALVALAYDIDLRLLEIGAAAAALGLLGVVAATARRGPIRRLYLQTLLLAWLERSGVAAPAADPRVGRVLVALDRLLAALPEEDMRGFMATPEAEEYLRLMEELEGEDGG